MRFAVSTMAEIDLESVAVASVGARCHLMPVVINRNGTAEVDKYFEHTIRKVTDNHLTASFRGRPLKGQELPFPEDYVGLHIQNSNSSSKPHSSNSWNVTHTFDKFTYWNWDKIPSANDKIQEAMTWIDVAQAIHGKPTED